MLGTASTGDVGAGEVSAGPEAEGQVSNTQAWMERYTRRIKPNERKWRIKSMRSCRAPAELLATSKLRDEVVSKVLLLARWRSKARKQADERTYTMAARRPWLSHLKEISERSGCVLGAAMEYDGIGPHVEMLLEVAHADEDRRLALAAEQQEKELTPMDVIQQRVRRAMRGVQLWTTNGGRASASDADDLSPRGGRRRLSVFGGGVQKESSGRVSRSGSGTSPAAIAAAAAARRTSLLLLASVKEPPAASAAEVSISTTTTTTTTSRPGPPPLQPPPPPPQQQQRPLDAASDRQTNGVTLSAPAAATAGPSSAACASDGGVPAAAAAADGSVAAAAAAAASAVEPAAPSIGPSAARAPQREPSQSLQGGQIAGGELTWASEEGVEAEVTDEGRPPEGPSPLRQQPRLSGPGLSGLRSGTGPVPGPEEAAATPALFGGPEPHHVTATPLPPGADGSAPQGPVAGEPPRLPGPTRGSVAAEATAEAAGRASQPGVGPVAAAAREDVAQPQEQCGPATDPSSPTGGTAAVRHPLGHSQPQALSTGGFASQHDVAPSLHDVAPSLGDMDACRVTAPAAGGLTVTHGSLAPTAAVTLTRQVRPGPLPSSLTLTKRGRRPAPSPLPAPPPGNGGGAARSHAVPRWTQSRVTTAAAAADGADGGGRGARGGRIGSSVTLSRYLLDVRGGHAPGTSVPVELDQGPTRPTASLTMVDAALFWGGEAPSPHGAGSSSSGGGGGGGGASLPRPAGASGTAFSRMNSLRPHSLLHQHPHHHHHQQHSNQVPSPHGLSVDAGTMSPARSKTDGGAAAAAVASAADGRVGLWPHAKSDSSISGGDGVGDSGAGGRPGSGSISPVSPSSPGHASAAPAQLSSPNTAAAAPFRTASGRSLTSWPGAAPSSGPGALVSHPLQLPHLEPPPAPSPAARSAAATGAYVLAAPPSTPTRLQPLPLQLPLAAPVLPCVPSPVLGSSPTARVGFSGPTGLSAPGGGGGATPAMPARLASLASPAHWPMTVAVADSPCLSTRDVVLLHQNSGGFGTTPASYSPGSPLMSASARALPLVVSESLAGRGSRLLDSEDLASPSGGAGGGGGAPGGGPHPRVPGALARLSLQLGRPAASLGSLQLTGESQPPQLPQPSSGAPPQQPRPMHSSMRPVGGSANDLTEMYGSGGGGGAVAAAAAAATWDPASPRWAPVAVHAVAQSLLAAEQGGLSRLGSDSAAALSSMDAVLSPGARPGSFVSAGGGSPFLASGTRSGPQQRMMLPELRGTFPTTTTTTTTTMLAAAGTADATATATASPLRREAEPPAGGGGRLLLLPEIAALSVGGAMAVAPSAPLQ